MVFYFLVCWGFLLFSFYCCFCCFFVWLGFFGGGFFVVAVVGLFGCFFCVGVLVLSLLLFFSKCIYCGAGFKNLSEIAQLITCILPKAGRKPVF